MRTARVITEKTYKNIAKPILFKMNPEKVHDATIKLSKVTSKTPLIPKILKKAWAYENSQLEQIVDGVFYKNPIGLSAGYDKNAELLNFIPKVGFGFMEVGSITKYAHAGNDGTRLWRLPKSKSILVYYGLKNNGADNIYESIKNQQLTIPLGINIAKTNNKKTCVDEVAIEDYVYSYKKFANVGNFTTINISCPNTYGGQPFHDKKRLKKLLIQLDKISSNKPIYIKLSPDISKQERQDIAALSFVHKVDGFICSNLTKERDNPKILDSIPSSKGGFSGKIASESTNQLIADMYNYSDGKKTIIGCGGVFTAEDAYLKIKLGASLIEMITGLIFEGPQVVGEINEGLIELLKKDKYNNISDAIGADFR